MHPSMWALPSLIPPSTPPPPSTTVMSLAGFHAFAGVPEWADASAASTTLGRAQALRRRRTAILDKAGRQEEGAKLTRSQLAATFQWACGTGQASMMARAVSAGDGPEWGAAAHSLAMSQVRIDWMIG
jgi:hypothetical protein